MANVIAQKKIGVICKNAPYGNSRARDCLEVAMMAATFDQPTTLLLIGDGLLMLVKNQISESIDQKNVGSMAGALPIYGVENVVAFKEDFKERGLSESDLVLPVSVVSRRDLNHELNQYDIVFSL